jgi:hypothetical protein
VHHRMTVSIVPILVSAIVSASVAVVVTRAVGQPYVGARLTAAVASPARAAKSVTLSSMDKTLTHDFSATDGTLNGLASAEKSDHAELLAVTSDDAGLKASIASLQSTVSALQSTASSTQSGVQGLNSLDTSTGERLYDVCDFVSSIWQRSFAGVTKAAFTTQKGVLDPDGQDPTEDSDGCYYNPGDDNSTPMTFIQDFHVDDPFRSPEVP